MTIRLAFIFYTFSFLAFAAHASAPFLHPESIEILKPGPSMFGPGQSTPFLSFTDRFSPENALDMQLSYQEQDQWCWAAVTQAVIKKTKGLDLRQCEIVSEVFFGAGDTSCCDHPTSRSCNHGYKIYDALPVFGALREHLWSPVDFESLAAEIDSGYPVPVRVAWDAGDAHYLVVYGYTGDHLKVFDPTLGEEPLTISELTRYRNAGRWVETYFTR